MTYPETRTGSDTDDFHGTTVSDPYRWLEDQNSPEVAAWVRAQAEVTNDYLQKLPGRDRLAARLGQLYGLPSSGAPELRGGRWFRRTNDGAQQQSVLRVAEEPFAEGRVLIDPNPVAADGTTALAGAYPDPTGRMVAWSYQEAGSDWRRWRVRYIDSGEDLTDDVRWSKFCEPQWLGDSSGFVYIEYPPTDPDDVFSAVAGASRLMLHRLGTPQDADEVLYERPDEPNTTMWPWIDASGRWLAGILDDAAADRRSVWLRDLHDPDSTLRPITEPAEVQWSYVSADADGLILQTDLDAGRGRIVHLNASTGQVETIIAERTELLLQAIEANGRLVMSWLADAHAQVTVHSSDGTPTGRIELPTLGSVTELSGSDDSPLVFLNFSSYDAAPRVLQHDLDTGGTTVAFETALPEPPDGAVELVTEQIWITSADGTRLPAFVLHRADVSAENGPHPTCLYGYGGFNVSITPAFAPALMAFTEAGGVWVVATLRGGGEYGADWHDAGRRDRKQNVFDDAIAAAEHLIATGWTTSDQLAVNGGSNGGLLVGALVTQRPDLFAAAVPQVGVMDMLRYEQFTIGWAWAPDYGIASRSKAEFDTLYAYSPLHRLREGAGYPPVLTMTADHDDRVVPAHSFKFAARLQAVSPPDAVALLRVDYSAGHGLGKSKSALTAERVDLLAFVAAHTGLAL